MSTTTTIRAAVLAQLLTAEGLPDVAVEGVKYERKANVPFVRMTMMPSETINNSIGENFILQLNGLTQFSVFYPALRGVAEAEAVAQAIVDVFTPSILLDGAEQIVIDSVWISPIREEQSWVQVPVVMRWRAFRNK